MRPDSALLTAAAFLFEPLSRIIRHRCRLYVSAMSAAVSTSYFLANEAATLAAGQALARALTAPAVVWLYGDLGAGKTTLVRGLVHGLGHAGPVKSPTYALVESYALGGQQLHHFDLYRFTDPDEWLDAGLSDLFGPDSLCLIEWPLQGGAHVPAPDLALTLTHDGVGRRLDIRTASARSTHWLNDFYLNL